MSDNDVDYSELPELVWEEIMKRVLSPYDRLNLSYCCRALNNVFHNPALWHKVRISVVSDDGILSDDRVPETKITGIYFWTVKKFSYCIRSLTLDIHGNTEKLPIGWKELFTEIDFEKMLRLSHLSLNIKNTNVTNLSDGPAHKVISSLLSFLKNSTTLKSLTIDAWPQGTVVDPKKDIIYALLTNKTLKDHLETLSLFWLKKSVWVTKNANVTSLIQTKVTLNHLCALTVLSLRSSMLDSEAIEILSKSDHAKLKQLNVLIIYSRHNDKIPEVSSESWIKLLNHSPKLQVECSVMTPTPMMELACILKPEVPLVAITFLKFSRCDGEILFSLAEKYSSTLRKLVDFTDWGESDDAIMFLAETCTSLNYLVYHRSTHYTTVPRLAKARGTAWQQFEFREYYIDTKDRDEDTDVVIRRNDLGDFCLKEVERYHENKDIRQTRLDSMVADVREIVGFHWFPITVPKYQIVNDFSMYE